MLNNKSINPPVLIAASFNNGHEAHSTPAMPRNKAIKMTGFNFFFKKNIEKKLIKTGLVAMANAPMPAVTCCMATT